MAGGGNDKWMWTKEEDAMLVDAMMQLYVSGKYVNAKVNPEYAQAVLELMDPKVVTSAKSVKLRMKRLKFNFYLVQDMLVGKYMSGFSWDAQNLRVVADDQVWDTYIKTYKDAARFIRIQSFPQYDKLCIIYGEDNATRFQENDVGGEGVVVENQVNPCVESKDLRVDEDAGSTHGVLEGVGGYKRKRDEEMDLCETCVESLEKRKNIIDCKAGINAANDMMDKVVTQIGDLPGLTLDERLLAMSVIGRSAPLAKMFDRLNVDGKVRMAQMVANGSIR
ncbi:hypothetical protein M8C21_009882 [Ambrosia artemisiifolia]|uniref:Myb/SANT-like domain-containing protein n=1 Tax=Ambrosia artemisiifolia TaxID=4212 RepID=A0AAD5DBA4_AMBAR|nr:hypothetical protein M8C21_009882 [Ambrosia artemisiifolia]